MATCKIGLARFIWGHSTNKIYYTTSADGLEKPQVTGQMFGLSSEYESLQEPRPLMHQTGKGCKSRRPKEHRFRVSYVLVHPSDGHYSS